MRNDRTSKEMVQDAMLEMFPIWPPTWGRTRRYSFRPRSRTEFTSFLAAAVNALRSAGAPSMAHATQIGIFCSPRLSTRCETRVSTWSRLERSASRIRGMGSLTYVCGLDTGRCAARNGRCGLAAATRHDFGCCSDVRSMLLGKIS